MSPRHDARHEYTERNSPSRARAEYRAGYRNLRAGSERRGHHHRSHGARAAQARASHPYDPPTSGQAGRASRRGQLCGDAGVGHADTGLSGTEVGTACEESAAEAVAQATTGCGAHRDRGPARLVGVVGGAQAGHSGVH